jgi:hypothetical protein
LTGGGVVSELLISEAALANESCEWRLSVAGEGMGEVTSGLSTASSTAEVDGSTSAACGCVAASDLVSSASAFISAGDEGTESTSS